MDGKEHPQQIGKLYEGSALCEKYGRIQDSHVRRMCFAGYDEDKGAMRQYIDESMPSIASFMLRDLKQIDELTPLLNEGKRELAKAKKAAA
jgi:hypothetical protein